MNKISADQLAKRACVYIRQSTPGQVQNNLESQRLQYALVDRALHSQYEPIVDLPWVIDPIGIDQQDTNDTTELQQRVPIAAGAREA